MGVGSTPPDAHGATATHSPDAFSPFGNFGKRVSLLYTWRECTLLAIITESYEKSPAFFV